MTVDPAMRMTTWLTFVWKSPVSQHPPHSQIRTTLEMHTGAVTRWWTGRGHADTLVIDRVTSGFSSHTKPGHKKLMWINSVILAELSAWELALVSADQINMYVQPSYYEIAFIALTAHIFLYKHIYLVTRGTARGPLGHTWWNSITIKVKLNIIIYNYNQMEND